MLFTVGRRSFVRDNRLCVSANNSCLVVSNRGMKGKMTEQTVIQFLGLETMWETASSDQPWWLLGKNNVDILSEERGDPECL